MMATLHGAPEARAMGNEILSVYDAAWSRTEFALSGFQLRDFSGILDRHLERKSFRLAAARDGDGSLAGFAYGYTSKAGGWWRDMVTAGLEESDVAEWFSDCFEFVELAVRPESQGRGVGGRLHDVLLTGLTHRTSVLSTQSTNEPALRLYRSRGWSVIEEQFYFPNRTYPYTIMGLDLTARIVPSRPSA